MLRMALGHSDEVDLDDALEAVLEQCSEGLDGAEPDAGFLLATYESDPTPLVEGIRKVYPDVELAGSTSAAEMSSVGGFQEGSVVLALFASDTVDVTAGLGTGVAVDPEGAARSAVREAR